MSGLEVEATLARAQDVAAEQAAAASDFFGDIDSLVDGAADFLAQLTKQADEADALKLRTAALKLRLGQLAWERRSREAAEASAFEAKQRELDRLLEQEQGVQQGQAAAGGKNPTVTKSS